jgi:hypothetical protein
MWKAEWNAVSSRIAGIIGASAFLFQNAQTEKRYHLYSPNILIENCNEAAKSVIGLLRYRDALSTKANDALQRFSKWWDQTSTSYKQVQYKNEAENFQYLEAYVVLLASVRSELDHVLADSDAIIRSHVNRAFLHLQRSLIADMEIQNKWMTAFQKGETACEKLGAVHLLLHGIWAFKADSSGQRTDLILGNHLAIDDDVLGATHGMVLTEWKLLRDGDNPENVRDKAKNQASLYSDGGLAGFQLDSERYLVLVGKKEFDVPNDERIEQVSYKVIPLFLTSKSPSIVAKQKR